MTTSVSSERAFSQGGITISKRRNRLKGDIVEALQCMKCAIQHNLLFKEHGPCSTQKDTSSSDTADDAVDTAIANGGPEASTENSWDTLLDDDDDEIYDTMSADTVIAVTSSVPVV